MEPSNFTDELLIVRSEERLMPSAVKLPEPPEKLWWVNPGKSAG
jgi:hypothetical protein